MFKNQIVQRVAQCAVVAVAIFTPQHSWADEGGVSFWVPGFFGAWLRCRNNLGFRLQRSTITRRSKLAVMSDSRGKCHAEESRPISTPH